MERFLERGRLPFLLLLGILTCGFGWQCLTLQVDRDNRSMSADLAEIEAGETRFKELFGSRETVLVAVTRSDLFEERGKAYLTKLVAGLSKLEGVAEVRSLADSDFVVPPHLVGLLVSEDRRTAGIHLQLTDFTADPGGLDRFVDELDALIDENREDGTRIAVAGIPLEKRESSRLVLRDQRIFSPLCFVVLGVVLLFVTRHLAGMLLPLAFAGITILWTLGLYALSGRTLNMITSLLPPVIMTLSASTTIHLYMEWRHGEETGKVERVVGALRKLFVPCFFASGTTMIGFLSLLLSDTPAVRSFGLFAALGVAVAFVIGLGGMAAILSYCRVPEEEHHREGFVGRKLVRLLGLSAELAIRHPGKVVAVTLALCVLGISGALRVESNTDLLTFLGEKSSLVKDTRYIDEHLTGTGVIELLVKRTDGEAFDGLEEFTRISDFENEVRDLPHVKHALGLVDIPQVGLSGGGTSDGSLVSDDRRTLRITVAAESVGTREGEALVSAIRDAASEKLGDGFEVTQTGAFHRIVAESNRLTASQVKSFGVALVFILLSIGLVFRSLRYTALAFLPNVAPLLIAAAIMGYGGIDLSAGTSMIASVMIGIAVDDTIHFLSAFRRNYRGCGDEAIRETLRSTGLSLFATTLALSLGFWVAVFGSFQPTVYFALLSGITMWLALAFDLVVLPSCLKLACNRWEPRTT